MPYIDTNKSTNESGSALVYILIAIALLAALTFSFMEPSSQQTSSQNTFKTVAALQGQIDQIRSSIQECFLSYPRGDNTIDTTASGDDEGARTNYPIRPDSGHFGGSPASVIASTAGRLVRDMRCPGQTNGPNPNDHALMFGGNSGKFMGPAPDLFEDWQYYNGIDGVFFWTYTDKTDAFITSALTKLDDNLSECEADLIDASSAAQDLDAAGDLECSSGTVCFRIRMITNTASAEWNGDADNDETITSATGTDCSP